MDCLRTDDLSHHYGADTVLDGVDLRVPAGSLYGFLGPNGAGKTTTLRLVLGLIRRQQGRVTVFGLDLERHRLAILRRIGSLIEGPSIYEQLTARENLQVLQPVLGCPRARIDEVLELVGLAHTGRKRAGQFSLGMKQRLGLAAALLPSPELLILDEPTNGLDPGGIAEMRALLTRLNREHGTTILVSSHLLAEIDRLVTHVGVIDRGRLRFQGTIDELRRRQQQVQAVVLRTGDDARALSLLREAGIAARSEGERIVLEPLADADVASLARRLVAGCVDVHEIGMVRNDLESIFMDLVEARA